MAARQQPDTDREHHMAMAKHGKVQRDSSARARLTRRDFLVATAAATPLLLARNKGLGYEANEEIQMAVVGLGGRGKD